MQGKANEPICVLGLLDRARAELGLAVEATLAEIVARLDDDAPRIAIISGSPDHPAHVSDRETILRAAAAIWRLGALPFSFGIPVICDGTAQNHLGMCYSLESRNAVTRLVVGQMEAHAYHGAFVLQGCDKTPFAVLNALALLDRLRRRRGEPPVFASFAPVHVLRGGSIPEDLRQDLSRLAERAEAVDRLLAEDLRLTMGEILQCISNASFQGLFQRLLHAGLLEASRLKEYERRLAENTCHPQGGICAFNGTGNSCRYAIAALGLVHPSLEWLVAPPSDERIAQAVSALLAVRRDPACGVSALIRSNIANAVRVHSALGGSTNLAIHLVSAMICSGVRFTILDYDRIRREVAVPQLLDYSLSAGRDLYQLARQVQDGSLAGVATVLHELRRHGVPVDERAPTVAGQSWGTRLQAGGLQREARDNPLILASPKRLASGVEVLSGNFFETAVIKVSGLAEAEAFDEKIALVLYFENEEAAVEKLLQPRLLEDCLGGLGLSAAELGAIRRANSGPGGRPGDRAADAGVLFRQMLSESWIRLAIVIAGQGPQAFGMPEMFTPMQHINHNGRLRTTTALLSDGRYSGTTYGAAVGHVTPEAWNRGGILYLQNGDLLHLRLGKRRIDLLDPLAMRQGVVRPFQGSLESDRRELGERRLQGIRERRRRISPVNLLEGVTDAARGVVPEILWAEAESASIVDSGGKCNTGAPEGNPKEDDMAGNAQASQSAFEKIKGLNPRVGIAHIEDPSFLRYGRVLRDYRTGGLMKLLASREIASDGAEYEPGCFTQAAPREEIDAFARDVYGGMSDLQVGCVHGRNTKLNALEYHKSPEVVVPGADMVVFIGLASEIEWPAATFDTSHAQAFFVPRGATFEMFPWCLHYAPAHVSRAEGFRCAVVLPRGTNTDLDFAPQRSGEGRLLLGKNKWVLAHPEEPGLKAQAAHIGLRGNNTELVTL